MSNHYASRMNVVKPSAIRQLLEFGADPTIISFGGGYPDADMFPVEQLHYIYDHLLKEKSKAALQYNESMGMPLLREQICERMKAEGIACEIDNILILQGSQQGLDLVGKLFLDSGDTVLTEAPTFLGALIAFNPNQPNYVSISMDNEGLITDHLEENLKANKNIKFLYTVPDFHNPTGITLSLERRKKLIELANQYNFIVIEDTPYREIRYQGNRLPTLKSMDTEGRVIYLGSFSKVLAPGLRIGWSVASKEITEKLGLLKLAADTQCSTLNMAAVSMYLNTFNVEEHLSKIRKNYLRRKELMLNLMEKTLPKSVSFTNPDGGLFTWLKFPEGFDTEEFMMDHVVPKAKVAYVPGETFFSTNSRKNFARFSYSTVSDEKIIQGITLFGDLLKGHL
ncbi:UNVERIFIED_ORG: DNA-binding transcriptional MocR family regulator [Rahnella aquatilis]